MISGYPKHIFFTDPDPCAHEGRWTLLILAELIRDIKGGMTYLSMSVPLPRIFIDYICLKAMVYQNRARRIINIIDLF